MGQRQSEPSACSDSTECWRKTAALVLGLGVCSEGSHRKGWSFSPFFLAVAELLEWCVLVGRGGSVGRLEQSPAPEGEMLLKSLLPFQRTSSAGNWGVSATFLDKFENSCNPN